MANFKYSRYITRVASHPWAITPDKFSVIRQLFIDRAAGRQFSDDELAERLAAEPGSERQNVRSDGAIAVIPIHGVVAHRADSFEASSGGTSVEMIGRALSRVVADDSIKAVLLDFDTPGGSVDGVPELAAKIAKWTAFKPIVAHVNALCASAGYWLAAGCSEIVVTPSGMVGSVGVFMALVDESEALKKEGITVNVISAGEWKTDGAPWAPLSDEGRAHLQGQVDAVYKDFLSAIAKGRGISMSEVKANYDGRVYDAKESLRRGQVDRIATVEETLQRMMSGRVGTGRSKALSLGTEMVVGLNAVMPDGGIETTLELLPAIEGHAHSIDASGQPTCGCSYPSTVTAGGLVQALAMTGGTSTVTVSATTPDNGGAAAADPKVASDRDALDLAVEETR